MACACVSSGAPAFQPAGDFDLQRYLGTWYEIARFPHSFEKDMDHVTAHYSLKDNGMVRVENRGVKKGKQKTAVGKAKFAGAPDVGHLKVSFFWIFYGDYIIVELDPEYQWALVVGNSTDYLWILSRTPELAPEITEALKERARQLGFDMQRLIMVDQSRHGAGR